MHPHCDILVTGAAGFLGSHLCDRLLELGHRVIGLDELCPGTLGNLAHLRQHPRFRFLQHRVVEQSALRVDRIFHLACAAGPPHDRHDPVGTTLTSVVGTWRMLELARRCNARLLLASTREGDGDPAVHPQHEDGHGDLRTIGTRAGHDEGMRCAETLCFDYLRQHGVAVRVAHIFDTYGPRMLPDDGCVVGSFIVQALRGEDITLYGGGRQTRCLCFVDDTVEGLVRLMEADAPGPVDLGSPQAITMLELAEAVLERTGSRSRLVFRPQSQDDRRRRCPDIGRAQQLLEWSPRVPLTLGLRRTVQDFAQRLGVVPPATQQRPMPVPPARVGSAGLSP